MDMTTPTASVAHAALDTDRLHGWWADAIGPLAAPLQAERLAGGQSNPSWRLRSGGRAWVLRAKPGPASALLPSAHAIEREFRVLAALQGSGVPVPRVQALCEDEAVIGAAFYVMDWVEGRVLRDAHLPGQTAPERAACHADAVRVLAALHQLDWRARGLQDFGRTGGYFSRLVRRWHRQYQASASAPMDAMERLAEWLPANIPAGADGPDATCLTHGDFRLENLMFHPAEARVVAVLDWELATLGHPLGDLAYHGMAWHLPPGALRGMAGLDLAALGIPGLRAMVEDYAARTGWPLEQVLAGWPFYLAFNLFRLAAILTGIGARARDGSAAHPDAAAIARMSGPVAELGWSIASGRRPALPV